MCRLTQTQKGIQLHAKKEKEKTCYKGTLSYL